MKNKFQSRTDLALEIKESFEEDNVEISGVIIKEKIDKSSGTKVTKVIIEDEHGEKAMGKPIGTYITIESHDEAEKTLFMKNLQSITEKCLNEMFSKHGNDKIFVVGLGNRDVTPDALGSIVVDNLFITRHLINEYGEEFKIDNNLSEVSAIAPGVMAQTGIESLEIIKSIVKEIKPHLVIVIDALAARSVSRLNTTIQITDTGISPGSGVGNNRKEFNKKSLGVDVIAIGVPTVVDAGTIIADALRRYMISSGVTEEEGEDFINEVRKKQIENMFVTPKDIDESVKRIGLTISEALNNCLG